MIPSTGVLLKKPGTQQSVFCKAMRRAEAAARNVPPLTSKMPEEGQTTMNFWQPNHWVKSWWFLFKSKSKSRRSTAAIPPLSKRNAWKGLSPSSNSIVTKVDAFRSLELLPAYSNKHESLRKRKDWMRIRPLKGRKEGLKGTWCQMPGADGFFKVVDEVLPGSYTTVVHVSRVWIAFHQAKSTLEGRKEDQIAREDGFLD